MQEKRSISSRSSSTSGRSSSTSREGKSCALCLHLLWGGAPIHSCQLRGGQREKEREERREEKREPRTSRAGSPSTRVWPSGQRDPVPLRQSPRARDSTSPLLSEVSAQCPGLPFPLLCYLCFLCSGACLCLAWLGLLNLTAWWVVHAGFSCALLIVLYFVMWSVKLWTTINHVN